MFFWNFFYDPIDVGNLISGSSAFSKSSLNIWKLMVHCGSLAWRILEGCNLQMQISQSVFFIHLCATLYCNYQGLWGKMEMEMETHSSILAWEIQWTEELGELQSMGSKVSDTTEATKPPNWEEKYCYKWEVHLQQTQIRKSAMPTASNP